MGVQMKKLEEKVEIKQVLIALAGSFVLLLLLSFILKFDSLWTYLFGFLISTLLACVMIAATRILHDKLPNIKEPSPLNFIADTSYGVYLFHWPFYIIFSQLMGNGWAVLLTTILSFGFAALSFYILEPTLAGRKPRIFGKEMNVTSITKPIFYSFIPLTFILLIITVTAPSVGAFEESLIVNALNQADTKMQTTRKHADQKTATNYNVAEGTTVIGDSVTLRSAEWIQEAIPDAQVDAVVSRNLVSGLEFFKNDIANQTLLQNVVLALGTNPVDNYEELLDQYIELLPKGHRLILVTPYDGRTANDPSSIPVKMRQYELELAKKYDFLYVADWYQVAINNPQIWIGTDYVHYGADSESMAEGSKLYSNMLKEALAAASSGSVKP